VTWDTLFQPGDVRSLCARHKRVKGTQRYFDRIADGRIKTGTPTIGTVTRRTARLVDAYLAGLGIELLPDSLLFRTRSGAPYGDTKLSHDFAAVRAMAFPGETRQLRDMRRSGTVEAVAGGAEDGELSDKLANSIDRSTTLRKTYAPVRLAAVVNVDEARARGRKKSGGESGPW
jgi:hypothetical protein